MVNVLLSDESRKLRQPFSFPGAARRKTGVLCVHGFTGDPSEMRPLGDYLAQRGYRVEGILLPGHGGDRDELKGVKWHDWVEATRNALLMLRSECEQVFIVGESMGGLIALHLGTRYFHLVDGVVALATPSAVNDARTRLVRFAKYVIPYFYPLKDTDFRDPVVRREMAQRMQATLNLDDPKVVKALKESTRIPLEAIHELVTFNAQVLKELPSLYIPVIFMQGKKDQTIAPNSAHVLASLVASKDKQVIWLNNSGHVLPCALDKDIVFYVTEQFIQKHPINNGVLSAKRIES